MQHTTHLWTFTRGPCETVSSKFLSAWLHCWNSHFRSVATLAKSCKSRWAMGNNGLLHLLFTLRSLPNLRSRQSPSCCQFKLSDVFCGFLSIWQCLEAKSLVRFRGKIDAFHKVHLSHHEAAVRSGKSCQPLATFSVGCLQWEAAPGSEKVNQRQS